MSQLGRPPTRPNPLDEGIAEKIAERLSGGESMFSICRDPSMPNDSMVYRCIAKNAEFAAIIARARETQQDFEADNVVRMADDATEEDWQVVKLRIWARQWRAAKLAPKKYGEQTTLRHEGDVTQRHLIADHQPTVDEWLKKKGIEDKGKP